MKLALTSTLSILLLALSFSVLAQNNSATGSAFSNAPYKTGERLTYNVAFSNFPSAAHVEIEVVGRGTYFGRDAIQLRAHVETTGVVNVALLAINNDYVTYIDPETGLPFRSQETVRDAAQSSDSSQEFNQSVGTAAIPAKQRAFPGTYDILSALYRARSMPLTEGASYSFSIRGETATYNAELKVTGREVIRTNVGSFGTMVSQIKVDGNSSLRSLKAYFSDDERHVPVLVTARVSTGTLTAELAGSEFVTPVPVATPTPQPATIAAAPTPTPRPIPTSPPTANQDWPFKVGEQLNYQVFLGASTTPVGSANFQVRGRSRYYDRDGFMLTVKAQTSGAAARVFVANDQINSYVDPGSLLPYRTEFSLSEGNRHLNQILTFNQDTGSATSDSGAKFDIPVGTFDYLSFFYAVRAFNLNPPKRNAISILVDNKPKTLFISSVKREVIQLNGQPISAIALALTTDDLQSDKYQLRIWVSDDKRRLPMRITCTTEIGPVRADLVILPATSQ